MSSRLIWQTISTSPAETERLGSLLGNELKGGEVIELRADLGGGKTTFVRGLAQGAGSRTRAASPTFTLSRIYKAKKFPIHHYDFYRLANAGILVSQLTESISQPKTVVLVEWSEIVKNVLPKDHINIEFKPLSDNPDERQISISYTQKDAGLIEKLETAWQASQP